MRRISFVRRAVAVAAGLGLVAAVAATPAGAVAPTGNLSTPVPGVLGVDHIGITVPDIVKAREWFRSVMGCVAPLRFGPIADPQGTLMKDLVNVNPKAVINQINQVRCGTGSSIELFQYTAPNQKKTFAKNSDIAGHHVAFYVTDIDAATKYMESQGVKKFLGPFPVTTGPAAGQTINYFQTPFGLYIELISYPNGMAYEKTTNVKLWNPGDVAAAPKYTKVPGLLGVDHFGMTVPNIASAIEWYQANLGCQAPLTFGPISDPNGTLMKDLVDVNPKAVIDQITMLKCGANGANIELFQYQAPDQNTSVPLNSDYSGNHIAFYVKDEAKAVSALAKTGIKKFLGPFPVTQGPAAGQTINYFLPPTGHYLELISYPKGMAYQKTAKADLWSPNNPNS